MCVYIYIYIFFFLISLSKGNNDIFFSLTSSHFYLLTLPLFSFKDFESLKVIDKIGKDIFQFLK